MATLELDRKKRDILIRKTDILKAAERVFAVKGYYRATMSDIAEEAQYAVGTLYLYFKDKQGLFINLFEEKMKKLLLLVKEKAEEKGAVLEKIRTLIEVQLNFFITNENFFRIFFGIREDLQWKIKGNIPPLVIQLMFRLLDYVSDLIKQAQLQGIIKKDYSSQRIAYIVQSIIRSIILPRIIQGAESKTEEDVSTQSSFVMEVLLNGVGAK